MRAFILDYFVPGLAKVSPKHSVIDVFEREAGEFPFFRDAFVWGQDLLQTEDFWDAVARSPFSLGNRGFSWFAHLGLLLYESFPQLLGIDCRESKNRLLD